MLNRARVARRKLAYRIGITGALLLAIGISHSAGAADCDSALLEKKPPAQSDSEILDYLKNRYGIDPAEIRFTPKNHYPAIVRGVGEDALLPKDGVLETVQDTKVHDVIVVGGGPAGLTSALYSTDAGKEVLVIDPNAKLGGLAQGSTLAGVRVGTGAAYSIGADNLEEYKIFQHIGMGKYKKSLVIKEPIDGLFKDGKVYPGIWEEKTLKQLPSSFSIFKQVLLAMDENPDIYDVTTAAGKELDDEYATDLIRKMPQMLSEMKDAKSKAIYQRFVADKAIDPQEPMKDVINLMNRYCRSALGDTADHVSAYSLVDFYVQELDPRYTGTYGTGEIVGKLLNKLKDPKRALQFETGSAVSKIINTADGVEVHYVKDGKEIISHAKALVFSASLKLAPELIENFAAQAPEAAAALDSLRMSNYAVDVVRMKGHPIRMTYDLWMGDANDAKLEPTDEIQGRWQDPNIKGYGGMRGFKKDPADDYGEMTIYDPLGPQDVGNGFTQERALGQAEGALDWIRSQLDPYLRKNFGQSIKPELLEVNRWPLSIHIAAPGWMQKAAVFKKPVGNIFFANNNMGLPEFERALVFGKEAADKVLKRLASRGPASVALPALDPSLAAQTESCELTSGSAHSHKRVFFFKQWHLSPSQNTTDIAASKALPQYENQRAIYEQLDHWIAQGKISTILAEGCPSPREIDAEAPEKFNGWSMSALQAKSSSAEYPDLLTNVAYKLEAKWKNRIRVSCGDDAVAIKKDLLAFSDARGIVGFLSRLEQFRKDPERARNYLDGVIELYHLKKTTTVDQAIRRLNRELKKTVDEIQKWNDRRNEKLVEAVAADPSSSVAVVFGGAHAAGVRKLLEKRGIGCSIYEPVGYRDDETQMLSALKELVNQRLRAM